MRIIGDIDHPRYKITVFSMNERVSVKIEDQLYEQTFIFRDGSGVTNVNDVKNLLNDQFLNAVDQAFQTMKTAYIHAISDLHDQNNFMEII